MYNPTVTEKTHKQKNKLDYFIETFIIGKEVYIVLFSILILSLIIYSPYIFGNQLYVYSYEIGSDSFMLFLPRYQSTAAIFHESGIPTWSFTWGLGSNVYASTPSQVFDPLNVLLYLFGDNLVFYLHYIQIIKILLTGLFACLLLKKLSHKSFTCILVPLLFAFNSDVIIRGGWYHHAIDTFLFCLMLYAFECYFQDNNKKILPIAGMMIIFMRSMSYPYIYGIVLFGYAAIRYLYVYKFRLLDFIKSTMSACGLFILGIGMGCVFYIPCLYVVMTSSRLDNGGIDYLSRITSITNLPTMLTAFLSIFSSILMKSGDKFTGALNYLEAPLIYSGLLTPFIIFSGFKHKTKKQRNLLIILSSICILYLIWPFMHQIFSGPTDLYYKTSSFVLTIIFLFVGAYGVDNLIEFKDKRQLLPGHLLVPAFFMLLVAVNYVKNWNMAHNMAVTMVLALSAVYLIIFFLWNKKVRNINLYRPLQVLLFLFVAFELTVCSYLSVNYNRVTVDKTTAAEGGYYWNHDFELVLDYLEEHDSSFYRLQKSFNTGYNDSQFYNYYGAMQYDSFINSNVVDFYNSIDSTAFIDSNHYQTKVTINELNALIGVKYYICVTGSFDGNEEYYEYLTTISYFDIYESKYPLSLGYTYSQSIDRETFEQLDERSKIQAMTAAFVKDDNSEYDSFTDYNTSILTDLEQTVSLEYVISNNLDFHVQDIENNIYEYTIVDEDASLIFKVDNDTGSDITNLSLVFTGSKDIGNCKIYWRSEAEEYSDLNAQLINMTDETKDYEIYIVSDSIVSEIMIVFGSQSNKEYSFELLSAKFDSDEKQDYALNNLSVLSENTFEITYFKDDDITGQITVDEQQMLCLTIPYDKGWTAKVDGIQVEIQNVNIGFSGILLEEGTHTIELSYRPGGLTLGIIVSICSLALYILIAFILPVLKKRKNK